MTEQEILLIVLSYSACCGFANTMFMRAWKDIAGEPSLFDVLAIAGYSVFGPLSAYVAVRAYRDRFLIAKKMRQGRR